MLKLTASLTPGHLTLPIIEGAAPIEDVELDIETETSVDKNSRKMLTGQFDIAEMSFATFIRARLDGFPIIALPIFTGRRFVQPAILCAPGSGITNPRGLAGKSVGLPQFWMTSSVWHRGILAEHYGVPAREVRWVTTAAERLISLTLPEDLDIAHMPEIGGIPGLLGGKAGVDCVMLPKAPGEAPGWFSPFNDLTRAQADYYAATGIFPIMHLVVMSSVLATTDPGLPARIIAAFDASKRRAARAKPIEGLDDAETARLFGADPWAYGIEENRTSLLVFLDYARAQGLLDSGPEPDLLLAQLFANP